MKAFPNQWTATMLRNLFSKKPAINYGKAVYDFDCQKNSWRLYHHKTGIVVEAKGWRAKAKAERLLMNKLLELDNHIFN